MLPLQQPAAKHLVGVSGGADSVALLHLLVRSGAKRLVVCHLNHRLRGRAATADQRFVERLAASLDLPCESGHANVPSLARQSGESLESAARTARHRFFAECAKNHRCPRVILAHHADDQAETILWNLARGSHGTRGMQPQQRIHTGQRELILLRPLLDTRRAEIRDFLTSNDIRWREDLSNATPFTARNRIRHEVLPLLAEITRRDVSPLLVRAAEADDDFREITRWAVDQANATDPQGRLHAPALRNLPPALQRAVILEFLQSHQTPEIDRSLLDRATHLLDPTSPPALNLPGGAHLRRRNGRLLFEPPKS